jgi:hypothetical protein
VDKITIKKLTKRKKEVEQGFDKNDKNILNMVLESLEIDSRVVVGEEKHIQRSVEARKGPETLENSSSSINDRTFCKQPLK